MLFVTSPSIRTWFASRSNESKSKRGLFYCSRSTAIPGGADRSLSTAGRLRVYFTLSALVGGFAAGLMLMYRSLFRTGSGPGSLGTTQVGLWLGWLLGRREL